LWPRFPTFHNVPANLSTVPRFLVSIGCHWQPVGGRDWTYLFGVWGGEVAVLTSPTVRYLSLQGFIQTPCLRAPIFRIQRVWKHALGTDSTLGFTQLAHDHRLIGCARFSLWTDYVGLGESRTPYIYFLKSCYR
jgi:hypothetical protein